VENGGFMKKAIMMNNKDLLINSLNFSDDTFAELVLLNNGRCCLCF